MQLLKRSLRHFAALSITSKCILYEKCMCRTTLINNNAVDTFIKRNLTRVEIVDDEDLMTSIPSRYVHVVDPFASEITFNLGTCPSKKVLHVACNDAGKQII